MLVGGILYKTRKSIFNKLKFKKALRIKIDERMKVTVIHYIKRIPKRVVSMAVVVYLRELGIYEEWLRRRKKIQSKTD